MLRTLVALALLLSTPAWAGEQGWVAFPDGQVPLVAERFCLGLEPEACGDGAAWRAVIADAADEWNAAQLGAAARTLKPSTTHLIRIIAPFGDSPGSRATVGCRW